MKMHLGTFILVLLFTSCRNNSRQPWQNTLFDFYQTGDSVQCDIGEHTREQCRRGQLFLTSEGKALYFFHCRHLDSITYFRGTYTVEDSVVQCFFESRLIRGKDPQKVKPHFQDVARQVVRLRNTGCESGLPELYTKDLLHSPDTSEKRMFTLLMKADLGTYRSFCKSIASKPALVDFQCVPGSDTAYKTKKRIDATIHNMIIDHYKGKNRKSRMRRADTDSTIDLSFSHLKKNRRGDDTPYLYVTIPKQREKYLFGDLSKDGVDDVVASPQLSEGGESYWRDIFVFVKEENGYDLMPVVSNMDLARCTRNSYNGSFAPGKIVDGSLTGITTCYTDDDAACCPSVRQDAAYVLENRKLKLGKKK